MQLGSNELLGLLDMALGISKDKAFNEGLSRVWAAQSAYLKAEAESNRAKSKAIIDAIVALDLSEKRLKFEYVRICHTLSPDAQKRFEEIFNRLQNQRDELCRKKREISIGSSARLTASECIYNISLFPGDILAASRKAGIYQHFAVYIGDMKVIHYAAENGDFQGHITIHEAPFSEFQGDSTCVYVLDFPDHSGYPENRANHFVSKERESPFIDLIRDASYHLYTPEETVYRAKSRIGEAKYTLPFNNCEHFAIWCKTGVHESHQVNLWISRLTKYALPHNRRPQFGVQRKVVEIGHYPQDCIKRLSGVFLPHHPNRRFRNTDGWMPIPDYLPQYDFDNKIFFIWTHAL